MRDLEWFKKRKDICHSNYMYSIQRADLLIISISGAGVYVILEVLKFGFDKHLRSPLILKIAGILFILAIIANVFGQLAGKLANYHDLLWCEQNIEADGQPDSEQARKIAYHDKKSDCFNKYLDRLDKFSIVMMTFGLSFVIVYFLINF